MYIHIHKYKYVNAYMLHTYCNKPYVLTDVNTCIKITYYISENGRIVWRHVQAHRLQLFSVEVEDEGHARG